MTAGPAEVHNQSGASHDLPCADAALLVPLKKSRAYRALRPRVANPRAADSWQEDGLHFFVFELLALNVGVAVGSEAPVAVFTMHPEEPGPISAVVVTPSASGEEAEIVDLLRLDSAYTAPVAGNGHQAPNGDSAADRLSNGQAVPGTEAPPVATTSTTTGGDPAGDGAARPGSELPARLRGSPEYLGWDMRNLESVDSWQEDELQFTVFQLNTATMNTEAAAEAPRVLFTVHAEDGRPVSAVMMTPPSGEEAGVVDVRGRDGAHHVRGEWQGAAPVLHT